MIGDVPKQPHSVGAKRWRCQTVVYWVDGGALRLREASFFNVCCSKLKPKSQRGTQTVCLQRWWSISCNLSSGLKFVPGVRVDGYHLMKVNKAKSKTALLPRTTLLTVWTLRRFVSQKLLLQRHRRLSCALGCICSLPPSIFQKRMCPLPDTRLDSYSAVTFQALKKAYHPNFHCAVKSNKWNPCGRSQCFRDASLCKEEVIAQNCSNVIWTRES